MRVTLDYETRSEIDLTKTGAITYAQHHSTSVICLGYKFDNNPVLLWIPERGNMPDDLWRAFQTGILVAHNAGFERAITTYTLSRYKTLTAEQKSLISSLPPSRWRCTAAKAAMCNLPRKLETVCDALNLTTKKDKEGHRLMLKYCKPRKPSKKNPKLWWDDKEELRALYRYCMTDVEAEYLLDESLPDLSDYEQKIWELDQKINDRGILIDIPTVKLILKMIDEEKQNVTEGVRKLSNGTIDKVTQTAKVLAWVNARGALMKNLQAATIRDKLEDSKTSDDVAQMLYYRQSGSKTSTAKYLSMVNGVSTDNRARELLLYCGATPTARWAGRRIQVQNITRGHLSWESVDKITEYIKRKHKIKNYELIYS